MRRMTHARAPRLTAVTARCFRNEVVSRDYAREQFQLVTGVYGVPLLRVVSPTLGGARAPVRRSSRRSPARCLLVFSADESGRTGKACRSLSGYARELGS